MDNPINKYKAFKTINLKNRKWPTKVISAAPIWCSVDLRDGNQALIEPMGSERKNRMFALLCKLGFKEIEVGFPSASQTDYDFVRDLIKQKRIPSDVNIQVLTQARNELIEKTFQSLEGAKNAIIHFYNSTSTLQRRVVFNQDKEGIKNIAMNAALKIKDLAEKNPSTDWSFEYSPESFTGTEIDYAAEICDSVVKILKDSTNHKIIINLPATVEMSTPNIYGDQIEWMHCNLKERDNICLSLHPHNDRGTAVAAAEFGVMAGADRIEGTLFGNGERTGNVDIVTIALNMLTQGIDPKLDFSNINSVMREVEFCNQLPVHPRHPYAGDLVFTAFSGSHQDAIKKGFQAMKTSNDPKWAVPYLPIDPADLGRSYEAVVRINSQSGKGGVAFLLEKDHGVSLPRRLQISMSQKIQRLADQTGKEISTLEIWEIFEKNFLIPKNGYKYIKHSSSSKDDTNNLELEMIFNNSKEIINGSGNGPIDAFINGLKTNLNLDLKVSDYNQSAISSGSDAKAGAYIELEMNGKTSWGVGINSSTTKASFEAIVVGISKLV
ncbi:MAG: 2-isopropylmalate synthase [Gammaproteobacteria bacterium TMED278]|jgi:2-isopropylmalate synthase|nr:2-isopropylmalate synthase [Gammaproteobacteria bacterium]OUX42297.1 MAG: 2-isopropylmalate synthase [Gammaproteobacteria bacterium TMED278]RCL36688.1 MAG: 2-isopropylmalate synthase [SAR86 cluster bacterium]URQ69817.1 2-isopropylmalate synthase [SAR86 cluster bacterium]|tara:strand:+ start:1092 stop:2744 length:1653 start_codon:yes stop_codon:yes gene_type:complete